MDEASKQYTAFTVENLGFFECKHMLFGLYNAPATFQRLMQNCMCKLNMNYCLIYLDDMIVFSKIEEEHLHCLPLVFGCFREQHLKIKPTKCKFLKSKINYLTHHVSKDGICPSKENLKAVAEFASPQTYTEIQAFWGFGHCKLFIEGFTHMCNHCTSIFLERVPARRMSK